jgi:amino acid adenylation domain-containing protein
MSLPHSPISAIPELLDPSAGLEMVAFPASPSQEAFFYLEKLMPSHPAFNVAVRFRIDGVLDHKLLKHAVDQLVERHEGLRTSFREDDGKLFQVIAPNTEVPLPITKISNLTGCDLETEIDRMGSIEARIPFDMTKDPLLRTSVLLVGQDRYILQITVHHSIADGWSIGIMTDDLAEFYNAALEDREPNLEPLGIQYADFTLWQREFLESGQLRRHLEFWKEKLKNYTELELPSDRPRPAVKSWDGDIVSRILPASLSEKVARLSREQGATMFHVFLAAFKVIASRYTGLEDIAVGSPVAGRTRPELEPVIGTFINSVILRTDLSGDPSFRVLVNRVRDTVTDAIEHQDLPFEYMVRTLQPRRESGRNPLFQINFTHQRDFVKPVSFGGSKLTAFPSRSPGAIFDLHFFMVERADGWRASCDFARDLFDRETALRLLGHFETLLDAATTSADEAISKFPILTSAEERSLASWSHREISYPSTASLGQLFLEQAKRQPKRTALSDGSDDVSYQDLATSAIGLSRELAASGVRPGDRVALCAPSVPEMIAAQIGILLAGAACVPIDPEYPIDRLRFMLSDCGARVILTTPDLAGRLPAGSCNLVLLKPVAKGKADIPLDVSKIPAQPDTPSHIFYTSGSTGNPKGVIIRHRGIIRLALGGGFMEFSEEDSFLQAAPISFDAATLEIWMPLLHGGRVVLTGRPGTSLSAIATAVKEQGVTSLWLTAGLFQTMVDEHLGDLKGLRNLLAGGDVLSPVHVRKAFEALPKTKLINGYGPTENTTFTCCHTITRQDLRRPSIPVGRPIGNTTLFVLDHLMRQVPIGISGELFTGGDGLAEGYLNRDDLTKEKFINHPLHGRLYRTGDICRWLPEGSIEFIGRRDEQVKVRGFRIELGEIETALASFRGVLQAKVAVRGDSAETKRILAWVVPATLDCAKISGYLSEKLPAYMRPAGILALDAFPLSANGKVDVAALPDASLMDSSPTGESREAPDGPVEEKLAAMWRELLGIEFVAREDDFFTLGGHSLMALRMFSRISREFGQTLPLATLLQHSTVAELAKVIAPDDRAQEAVVVPEKGNLVTLSKGRDDTPLILIHGGDGGVLFYRNLASRMPPELPLHAIESLELGKSSMIIPATIEETAAAYIRKVLTIQPKGPFRLAGYSFGGVVAHEMACQLIDQGHDVEFLGLFDTQNPAAPERHYSTFERLSVFWQQSNEDPIFRRVGLLRERIFAGIASHRRYQKELAAARSVGPADAFTDLRRIQVREENWRAMSAHTPRRYKGKITLFKTSLLSDKVELPSDYGWGAVASGLEIASVAGEHLTLFTDENVITLAQSLTTCLKRSHSATSTR